VKAYTALWKQRRLSPLAAHCCAALVYLKILTFSLCSGIFLPSQKTGPVVWLSPIRLFINKIEHMPNKPSAMKELRKSEKRSEQNNLFKRQVEFAVKQTRKAIDAGKKEEAQKLLLIAMKLIDKSAQKRMIKANTASRRKSRLNKAVNAM